MVLTVWIEEIDENTTQTNRLSAHVPLQDFRQVRESLAENYNSLPKYGNCFIQVTADIAQVYEGKTGMFDALVAYRADGAKNKQNRYRGLDHRLPCFWSSVIGTTSQNWQVQICPYRIYPESPTGCAMIAMLSPR